MTAENFREQLAKNQFQEIKQRQTLTGPHRDDLNFIVNGTDIRRFGSQGQQRTAALSLKLAEIELVKKIVKDYPVLLLDDVLSELDSKRPVSYTHLKEHPKVFLNFRILSWFIKQII